MTNKMSPRHAPAKADDHPTQALRRHFRNIGRVDDETDLSGAEDENLTHAVDAEETSPAETVIPEHLSQLLANTI